MQKRKNTRRRMVKGDQTRRRRVRRMRWRMQRLNKRRMVAENEEEVEESK